MDKATEVRTQLVTEVTDVFKELQRADIVGQMVNSRLERPRSYHLWIPEDVLQIPSLKEGDFRSSRSFAVKNSDDTERLRFHLPVPEDFDPTDMDAVDELPTPDEIYAELQSREHGRNRTIGRYAVSAHSSHAYISPMEGLDEEGMDSEAVWADLQREFDPKIDKVSAIYLKLINWDYMPQRFIDVDPITGDTNAYDL